MALALDGSANGTISGSSSSTVTAVLTTASPNDVIVAFCQNAPASARTVTSVAGAGIVFQGAARKTIAAYNSSDSIELWYGVAAAALAAVTITATWSGSSTDIAFSVFGISGADTVAIFDQNASLAAIATGTTGIPTVTGVSTTNANTMLIAGVGWASATAQTAGATFTLIDSVNPAGKSNLLATQYKIVSAAQASVSVPFGTTNNQKWGMIVDAIRAKPVPILRPPLRTYLRR